MELAEIIRQFETSLLRVVFTELAYRSYAFPRWLASFPEDKANNYENSWAPYGNIRQAYISDSAPTYVEGIEDCLDAINEARAAEMLKEINKSGIPIENKEHLHLALVFAFIPKSALEEMALANNIALPSNSGSGFGSLFTSDSRDKGKWALIKTIASELIVIEGETVVQKGLQSFCLNCNKNNPAEANHCMSCGRELPQITCPKCDATNPPQAKFCMNCGEER